MPKSPETGSDPGTSGRVALGFGNLYASVGDHMGHFYQTKEEWKNILVPFLKAGLEAGDKWTRLVSRYSDNQVLSFRQHTLAARCCTTTLPSWLSRPADKCRRENGCISRAFSQPKVNFGTPSGKDQIEGRRVLAADPEPEPTPEARPRLTVVADQLEELGLVGTP